MTYGVDQFVFMTNNSYMYYNTSGAPNTATDMLLMSASPGLLTYFQAWGVNTYQPTPACYDGAFYNSTMPLGTGGSYNG